RRRAAAAGGARASGRAAGPGPGGGGVGGGDAVEGRAAANGDRVVIRPPRSDPIVATQASLEEIAILREQRDA
ncbi:MAG: hypothetical protein H0W03_00215, partial [Solirubrobacterales bacterium]|nr:hypothetical protein [Solirubrobacterales bacterium]